MTEDVPRAMSCTPAPRALRIAVVYSRLPFPMTRGDQLTVSHLLSYLRARGHTVDLLTLATGGNLSVRQQKWLDRNCRRVSVFRHSLFDIGIGMSLALLKGWPLQVGAFANGKLARHVDASVRAGMYDVVYNYYLRTAYAVPSIFAPNKPTLIKGKPVVGFLALQLSQTLNTYRIYKNANSLLKRWLYKFESARVSRYEAKVWQHFSKTVLIGERDLAAIRSACRSSREPEIDNWVLCAHGTDVEKFSAARDDEIVPGRIVFSGSMRYEPNVQAAKWFIENCWEAIRSRVSNAHLQIVGQSPVAYLRSVHGQNGIEVTGTVADIGEHIRKATVCINPMRAAGGMQNKLIEYMACRKAVIATSIANEGIGAPPGTLLIADSPDDFAQKTIELLVDPAKAKVLAESARAYVVSEWTWESQFDKLEQAFMDALNTRETSISI